MDEQQDDRSLDSLLDKYGVEKEADPLDHLLDQYGVPREVPGAPSQPATPSPQPRGGFWADTGQAALTGLAQNAQQVRQLAKGIGRVATGGSLFPSPGETEPPIQPYQISPETKEEVDGLLQQPISAGWTNPRWYASHVVAAATGSAAQLGAGGAGALAGSMFGPVGTAVGGVVGFAGSSGALSFFPSLQAAKARGEDDNTAIRSAVVDSGIDTATAAAMGIALDPALPGGKLVQEQVRKAVSGPVKEALVNLGVIAPAIGETGSQVKSLVDDGKLRGPDEALTDWVGNMGLAVPLVAAHALKGRPVEGIDVGTAYRDITQRHVGEPTASPATGEPAKLLEVASSRAPVTPPDALGFYSQVRRVAETNGPVAAPAREWMKFFEGRGVKKEELEWLRVPSYLADASGKVSRDDLLTHIEDNAIEITETQLGNAKPHPDDEWVREMGKRAFAWTDEDEAPSLEMMAQQRTFPLLSRAPSLGRISESEFKRYSEWFLQRAPEIATEYSQYVPPGPKANYREVVFHWKDTRVKPEATSLENASDAYNSARRKYRGKVDSEGRWIGGEAEPAEYTSARENFVKSRAAYEAKYPTFKAQHFRGVEPEKNQLAFAQMYDVMDRDGKRTRVLSTIQSDLHQAGRERGYVGEEPRTEGYGAESIGPNTYRVYNEERTVVDRVKASSEKEAIQMVSKLTQVPDAPFKKNWAELVFKRMMRMAADEGMERLAWANGDQVVDMFPGVSAKQQAGLRDFYDVRVLGIAKRWANTLGMERGTTNIGGKTAGFGASPREIREVEKARVHYIELGPQATGKVQLGFPMFSKPDGTTIREGLFPKEVEKKLPDARKAANALKSLAKAMKLDAPLEVYLATSNDIRMVQGVLGQAERYSDGGYVIRVAVDLHKEPVDLYSTLAHEFGHVVMWHWFKKLPAADQLQIKEEWRKWAQEVPYRPGTTLGKVLESRNSAADLYYQRNPDERPFMSLTPEQRRYWSHFEEWFAEQTARWATTSVKPLSVAERAFAGISRQLLKVYEWWKKMTGLEAKPNVFVRDWLDSFVTDASPFAANTYAEVALRTQKSAQRSFERDGTPDVQAVPLQSSTLAPRLMASAASRGEVPPQAAADAAHADKINWVYRWFTSYAQLAEANPGHTPLQYGRDAIGLFNAKIRQEAEEIPRPIVKMWRRLHGPQSEAVAGLIEEYGNKRFLTPDEVARDVNRMPTREEFQEMVRRNKVSGEGLAVFRAMNAHIDSKLNEVGRILKNDVARNVFDSAKRVKLEASIDAAIAEERKGPYFPFMHDGEYSVEIKGVAGETLYHTRTRTKREQAQVAKDLNSKLLPGETLRQGFFAKDARPLAGIPGSMLDLMAQHLQLSDSQRNAIERLKAEQKPQIGLIRRARRRVTTPGWSQDFFRSYANYSFHTARLFAKAEYAPLFREYMKQAAGLEGRKAGEIAAFMQKHFQYMMDPKPDFAQLRGLIFNLRLGFSPTTAGLYLTQTPLGTYPWLGKHYGDVKALRYLAAASTKRANYYKRGNLATATAPELKARAEGAKRFVLDGGAAPELAAVAESANLTANTARGAFARGWQHYQEAAGTLLHLADTWNRRLAFDTTWHLAMDNPNVPYHDRVRKAYPLDYQRLLNEGWTAREATAYVAARHTVEQTHFVYQRTHRPQVMWGKSSALLMFQFWKQNMLFTLWNYPGVRMRSLMVMAGMAGALGLPGAKDLLGLIQAMGWQLFGKDWNLEREMRSYVLDHWGVEGDKLADRLLHGASRYGMGVPHVLDLLGHSVGLPKLPVVDRSSAIGMGDVLPVNLGEALGPNRDNAGALAKTAEDVVGAAFSYPFDLFKFLTDAKLGWGDLKRWEPVIPHWMANISKAYRWGSEGMERDRDGRPIVSFDANDTTQMAEVLMRALGYTPTRLSQTYEQRSQEMEIKAVWQVRREILMRQAWSARRVQDTEQFRRVATSIAAFNAEVPREVPGGRISPSQLLEFMRNKAKESAMAKQGLPALRKDIPLARRVQQMYPVLDEQQIGVR